MQIHTHTEREREQSFASPSPCLSLSLTFQFHSLHCFCFALSQSNAFNLCTLVASPFAATPPSSTSTVCTPVKFYQRITCIQFFFRLFSPRQHTHTCIARMGAVREGEVQYPFYLPDLTVFYTSYTLNNLLHMHISIKLSFFIQFCFKGLLNRRLYCFIMAHTFFIAS